MMLHVLLLGGCQTLDQVLNVNSTVSAKKTNTYNPEHLKRLKETNVCRDCDLQGAFLWVANLKGANLEGADLRRADLQKASLQGANLWKADLRGVDLQAANLQGAILSPEGVKIALESGAINVPEAVVSQCFQLINFPKMLQDCLSKINKKRSPKVIAKKITTYNPEHLKRLKETNVCRDCNFQGANLRAADFYKAELHRTDFRGANLQRAYFHYATIRNADLRRANLQAADFRAADLRGANLSGANLRGANLYNTNLQGANLKDANLQGADLQRANLQGAKLDPEGIKIAKASGAVNVPAPVVVAKKTPKVTPKKKPKPPVVAKVTPKKVEPPAQSGSGSGFFVSRFGHVITNEHVVRDCKSVTVGDNAKKQSPVTVEETDRRNDLALLKLSTLTMASAETKSLIRKLGIKVVPLASDGLLRLDDIELGEKVMVAGYPYGDIFSDTIKVTFGNVSATRGMGDDSGQFQLDAAVQPGNSGGPIYDEKGNIVGVVVSQLNKLKVAKAIGSMPENVNFGIKTSTVRQFLTSSGLPTKWSRRSNSMSGKELAKIAQKQTLMVVCHQ